MLATIAFGLFSDRSSYNESVSGAVIRTEDWGSGNTVKYWTQQYSYSSASITYTFSFAAPVVSASLVAPVDTPFPGSTGNGYLDVSTGGKWTTIDSCLSQYNGKTNAGYEPIDISPYVNGSTLISVRARLTNSGPVGGQFLRSASWDTTPALRLTVTEQNVTPTDVTLSGASIAENSGIDASVGTLSTTDGNTGDSFTYTLVSGTGSADNSYFNILGNELRANASFDFETKSSYSVRVRSTDQGGLSTEKSFAIYVANVDETPTSLALSAISIAENGGVNVVVGTLSTTDPDAGNAFTYSLVSGTGDIDNAAFNISGDQLRADASLDFETKSSYSIRIRSTDQGGLFTEKAFTIAVSNVNETPTAVALSAASIAENAGADAVVGSLSTTDPDAGDTFTYTLVTGTGSTDNAAFNISGNQLRASANINAGTRSSYSLRIRSTDQGGRFTEKAFTITVTPTNVAPTGIDLGITEWLLWNAGGQIWRSKPDGTSKAPVLTPSTGTSITSFDVDRATGRIFFAEDPSTIANTRIYSAAIDGSDRQTVYDGSGLGRVNYALTVDTAAGYLYLHSHDVVPLASQGPSFDGKIQRLNLATKSVTTLPTSFWYVHDLQISSGSQLYVTGFSDYEELSSRIYRQQLDGATNQEVPATGLAALNFALAERTNSIYVSTRSQSATTGNVYRIPMAGGNPALVFDGTQAIHDVECEEPTGLLYWVTDTSIYRTSIQGTNAEAIVTGLTGIENKHLSVVTSTTRTVPENAPTGTVVGLLSASDANPGNSFTYTLATGTGSDDNASFQIINGQLATNAVFDFEARSSYSVRIRATDQGGLFTEQAFAITVTNVNEPPTDAALSNSSIAENAGANTVIGTLSTADPDASSTFTYTLVSGTGSTDNAAFNILDDQLRATASLNFEAKSSHSIRVRSTDQGGLFTEKTFTIAVANVNETPTDVALSASSIAENAGANAVVGGFSTTDPDASNTFIYTLVTGTGSTDNAAFNISGNQLRATASLNFEAKSSYSIRVRATDQGGLFTEKAFTITVTNVNEAPTDIALSTSSIAENAGANALVGTLSTTDPDAGNTFTYSLVSGTGSTDNAAFTITANQLTANASFDFETKNSYAVRVRSTDQDGLFTEKPFTISVTDVNEAASFSFGFKHVNQVGADSYLVDSTGMRKYSEWQNPPITYWGPAANNAEGRLVYKFPFSMPASSMRLLAHSPSWDFFNEPGGYGRGASALEVSKDGSNWISLRNSLEPRQWGVDWTYNEALPSTVLGSNELWVRMRFYVESAPNSSYTDAQFGRSTSAATANVFEVQATFASNRVPQDIALSTSSIAENAGADAAVGTLSTTDPDAGNTFTYALVSGTGDTDNAAFNISGNQLRATASLNFEAKSSYSIRVRTTDQGGLFTEKAFTITVTNINEAPTDIALSTSAITENAGANAVVGSLSTTDPDAGDTFTYTLVTGTGSTDNAAFNISGNRLRAISSLDFETKKFHSVRIRSTDQGGLHTERAFTITVTDVVEDWSVVIPDGMESVDGLVRSGSSRLVKSGTGTLVLDHANSHTGGMVVNAGQVIVRNAQALGTGNLWIKPGATVILDVGFGIVPASALIMETGGSIDFGYSKLSVDPLGYVLADVQAWLRAGYKAGFSSDTAGIQSRFASQSRTIGYQVGWDGRITVGYAAMGDTDLSGEVDILDMVSIVSGGKFDSTEAASWADGDFNHDGRVDLLDIVHFVSADLFNRGSYRTATSGMLASSAESTTTSDSNLKSIDKAFAALAIEASTDSASRKKSRGVAV